MAIKMPDEALAYGEPYYWDQRYNAERKAHGSHYSFDWYCDLEDLWPVIETYGGEDLVKTTDRTLVVGCGNSRLSEALLGKGFEMIWSADICKVVISFMQARYEEQPRLQYLVMDARKMDRFPDDYFHLIVEKACLDSLFSSLNSYQEVLRMNQEVCRVLAPGRIFVCVSYGSPAMRMPHLGHQSLPWRVDCVPLPEKPGVYVYVCTKNATLTLQQRRRSLTARKGEDVAVGEVAEEVDVEWEKRKLAPSTVTFKDKYTPGHVRLVRVRDADTLLQALADSVMDKDG